MADKNVGAFSQASPGPNTHVLAVQDAPSPTANIDPVLIPIADVGGVGPSAYDVAVMQGYSGTEEDWLLSLVGPAGAQGPIGPTGSAGAGLIPDEYGTLDEAKIAQIETAGVDWVFVVNPDGDDRSNQNAPAGIVGDMSLHVIRYDAVSNAWRDFGQFTGVQGPAGPQGPIGPAGDDGDPGLSAYQVAVANGYVGTSAQWIASLQGPAGPPVNVQLAATVVLPSGSNPSVANLGSNTSPVFQFSLPVGTIGPAGPQGDPGPSIVPDEYGQLSDAKVTAIATADVDYNFLVIADGDTRSNQSLPAGIAGDMSGHLIRYEAGGTWLDLGPVVGVAGPAGPQGNPGNAGADGAPGADGPSAYQVAVDNGYVGTQPQWLASLVGPAGENGVMIPSYDVFVGHPDGVAIGGYPVTLHAAVGFTITSITHEAQGTATVQVLIDDVVVATLNITSTKTTEAVDIPIAEGSELVVQATAATTTYFGITMAGE